MGTFTFKWPHEAEEVYVTGTFDNWSKSEQLEKIGDHFEKTVTLSEVSEPIFYKFVVDGNWTTDHTAPQAKDSEGNDNNLLKPEDITKDISPVAAIMTTVAPESTTVDLAKAAPLETEKEAEAPTVLNTVAPESTTAELVKAVPLEVVLAEEEKKQVVPVEEETKQVVPVEEEQKQVVPVKELREEAPVVEEKNEETDEQTSEETRGETELSDIPGAFPATPAADLGKQFSINPLPATEGALNPVKLEPGAEIPESITAANAINNHVTLDKESYEKSDRIPGLETELPPVTNNMIPESSLPILANQISINSVAPESSTAALAAQAPLVPRVPEVVKESQEKANVAPEASGLVEPVEEKAQVESEILAKVSEAPSTSEGTAGKGTEKSETDKTTAELVMDGAVAVGETLLGAAIVAGSAVAVAGQKAIEKGQPIGEQAISSGATATTSAKDAVVESSQIAGQTAATTVAGVASYLPDSVKQALPASVQEAIHTAPTDEAKAPEVSPLVPAEVKESIDESGRAPEAAANTAAVLQKSEVEAELLGGTSQPGTDDFSSGVPEEVRESIAKAGEGPEAAANADAVELKSEVETELLHSVKAVEPVDEQPEEDSESAAAPQIVEPPTAPAPIAEVSKPAAVISEPVQSSAVEAVHDPTLKVEALKSGELTPGPSTTVDPIAEPAQAPEVSAVNQTAPQTETAKTEQRTTEESVPSTAQPSTVNGAGSTLAPLNEEAHTPSKPAAPVGEKTLTPGSNKAASGSDGHSTVEKKKKNRLSSFFHKLKGKIAQ